MSDLITYLEENIDRCKAQTLLFSLDCITKKIVERKYKVLKKKLVAATALAAAAIPVPGLNVAVKFRSLLEPNLNMIRFVGTLIGTYTAVLLSQSLLDLILPLIGSVISSLTVARVTY